jgi:hypothetical protein
MGALKLGSGTGSFRVRQSMRRAATALGIDHLQALVTLREIVTTATWQGTFRTRVVKIPPAGVNAARLAELEELSRSLPEGASAAELEARLDDVERRPALYGRAAGRRCGGRLHGLCLPQQRRVGGVRRCRRRRCLRTSGVSGRSQSHRDKGQRFLAHGALSPPERQLSSLIRVIRSRLASTSATRWVRS